MRHTLKRSEIVRGRKIFQEIFDSREKVDGKTLRCFVKYRDLHVGRTVVPVRIGVAVGRGLRRAVDRNRVKRLVREAYRLHKDLLVVAPGRGADLVFLYRSKPARSAAPPSYREIERDMIDLLRTIAGSEQSTRV